MEPKRGWYRRIKWRSFLCVTSDGPKSKVIGEVCFVDRWGKEYRWAPEWEDVWLLTLEGLATELTNDPEGPWGQMFKDLTVMALFRSQTGELHPRYPELVEELLDKLYLAACLDKEFGKKQVAKHVKLGPAEWDFVRCPQCSRSVRFVGATRVQGRLLGKFQCRSCRHEFTAEARS